MNNSNSPKNLSHEINQNMSDTPLTPKAQSFIKRILVATGALIVLIAIGAVALVIHLLPDMKEVSQSLKSFEKPQASTGLDPQFKEIPSDDESATEATTEPNQSPSTDQAGQQLKKEGFEKLLKMIDEDPKDLRVCQNLGRSPLIADMAENEQRAVTLEELMESRDDSFIEATRFPVKAIFQDEQVAALLKEISEVEKKNLSDSEEKSFLQKMGFYSKVAMTVGHLYQEKDHFEELGNRANHLALLAKLAAMKPELANDANITQFCNDLQTSIVQRDKADLKQERREILNLIRYAGLTPEELGFNPDEYIKLKIQHTNNEFRIDLSEKAEEVQETTL